MHYTLTLAQPIDAISCHRLLSDEKSRATLIFLLSYLAWIGDENGEDVVMSWLDMKYQYRWLFIQSSSGDFL